MTLKSLVFITMTILSYSHGAQALTQFDCRAQVVAAAHTPHTPAGFFAPTLVFHNQDSLRQAQYNEKSLSLKFNVNLLNANQTPYVILDGRTKNLQLNAHVSIKKSADLGVRVNMEDRITGEKSLVLLKISDSGKSVRLRTNAGSLVMTCYLK